jgi:hypothetical protein
MDTKAAIQLQQRAQRKRLNAPTYDPIRADCDIQEARALEKEAAFLLTPPEPLRNGAGSEVVPPIGVCMPGLENALQNLDNLSLEGTIQRTELADKAGVFELAIETAESIKAKNSVQKMLAHHMAAAHKHAMRLLGDSEKQNDNAEKCRMVVTASKLIEAFSKAATTLNKLQNGGNQTVTVNHVQINGGQSIIGMGG